MPICPKNARLLLGSLATELDRHAADQKLLVQILTAVAVVGIVVALAQIIGYYARSKTPETRVREQVLVICPNPQCKARNPEGQRYCGNCGARLS